MHERVTVGRFLSKTLTTEHLMQIHLGFWLKHWRQNISCESISHWAISKIPQKSVLNYDCSQRQVDHWPSITIWVNVLGEWTADKLVEKYSGNLFRTQWYFWWSQCSILCTYTWVFLLQLQLPGFCERTPCHLGLANSYQSWRKQTDPLGGLDAQIASDCCKSTR